MQRAAAAPPPPPRAVACTPLQVGGKDKGQARAITDDERGRSGVGCGL